MKYQELRNHILGSHLMRHDLEAFLIQSAYLESLLKTYIDFHFFHETDGKSFENKLLKAVKKDIEKYSLASLIDLLKRADLLSEEQRKLLDDYRRKRNTILHDLLGQVATESFEEELRSAYETGKKITDSEEFKQMENLLDNIEKERIGLIKQKSDLLLEQPVK